MAVRPRLPATVGAALLSLGATQYPSIPQGGAVYVYADIDAAAQHAADAAAAVALAQAQATNAAASAATALTHANSAAASVASANTLLASVTAQAGLAATSAASAQTHANNAASSASSASTHNTNAQAAATAAANSATSAANAVANFLSGAGTFTGPISTPSVMLVKKVGTSTTGGVIELEKHDGSTIVGNLRLQLLESKFYVNESGGTARGMQFPITAMAASAGGIPWGNWNVPNPLDKSGGDMTGMLRASPTTGALGVGTSGSRFEIQNVSGAGNAAYMSFHRHGIFAAHLGLDTDNILRYGGWSLGTQSHRVWHEGVFTYNLGDNGYIRFPFGSSFLIMQWGRLALAGTDNLISFPTSFINEIFFLGVSAEMGGGAPASFYSSSVLRNGLSSFYVQPRMWTGGGFTTHNNTVFWFAVGR